MRYLKTTIAAALLLAVLCVLPAGPAAAAELTLSWDAYTPPADFLEFRFYRSSQACSVQGPLARLMINGQPAALRRAADGVLAGTFVDPSVPLIDGPVCYEMDAVDSAGNVSPTRSNKAERVLNLLPPPAPAGLAVTAVTP